MPAAAPPAVAVTMPPLIVTAPQAPSPMPAWLVAPLAVSLPVPPDCPQMVRLEPAGTRMPWLAKRWQPSARMMFTSPLTTSGAVT